MSVKDNIARSFKTIGEMLTDRNVLDENELQVLSSIGQNELKSFSANKSIFNIDINSKVRIIYYLGKFKIADYKPFIEKSDFDLYIVVMGEKLTTNNIKSITEFEKKLEKPISTQVFELKEIVFNITKHILVPQHTVISDEEEINSIVEKYNLKNRLHLPLMLKTDPIAKYYDVKPGQLVKIYRISPSAGEYVVYRCCV